MPLLCPRSRVTHRLDTGSHQRAPVYAFQQARQRAEQGLLSGACPTALVCKALFGKGMGSKGPLVNSTATSLEFLGGPLPLRPLEGGECCRVLRPPLQLGKLLWAKGQWELCRGVHPAPTWAGATQVPPPSTPGPEPSKTPLFSHLPLSLDVPSTVQASFSENFHSLATHATTVSGLGRCRASWLASLLPL